MNSTARLDLAIEHRALAPRLPRCPLSELRALSGGARSTTNAKMVYASRCNRFHRTPTLRSLLGLRRRRHSRSNYNRDCNSNVAYRAIRQSRSCGSRWHLCVCVHAWTSSLCSIGIFSAGSISVVWFTILREYIRHGVTGKDLLL